MASRRKGRQKKGYLGRRRFGRGDVKNRRGSGNRGGRGMAGTCKHKGTWVAAYQKDYFGKHGFSNQNARKSPSVQLFEINRKAMLGKLERRGERHHFEFRGKVIATGDVTVPLSIKALSWSRKTEEKVKAAGGEISALG